MHGYRPGVEGPMEYDRDATRGRATVGSGRLSLNGSVLTMHAVGGMIVGAWLTLRGELYPAVMGLASARASPQPIGRRSAPHRAQVDEFASRPSCSLAPVLTYVTPKTHSSVAASARP